MTFDHVVPRCKGGETNWVNIATACHTCNTNKGHADEGGRKFKLLSKPHVPSNRELLHNLKEMKAEITEQMKNWEMWISNI